MAHFAEIDENNIVQQVIVIDNQYCPGDFPESEAIGQAFIESIGLSGTWKQCSYNNNFRNIYPGFGHLYLPEEDVFIAPQPFSSWTLDENYDWVAPIPMPETGGPWIWNENQQQWEEFS